MRTVAALILALALVGCVATQRQLYAGEPLDRSEIAIIREDPSSEVAVVRIGEHEVGGEEWEILPGSHEIVVEIRSAAPLEGPGLAPNQFLVKKLFCTFRVDASPGDLYVAKSSGHFEYAGGGVYSGEHDIWLVNGATGKRVSSSDCETLFGDRYL